MGVERTVATGKVILGVDERQLDKSLTSAERRVEASFKRVGDKTSKAGSMLTKSLTVGVVGLGVAAYKSFDEIDGGLDAVQIKTGKTGKALQGLQTSFKNVAKAVPADFQAVGDTLAEVNKRLGLTGKGLETVTEQALEMARMTGGDATTSIEKVSKALHAFNLPAAKAPELMDKMFVAYQKTGVGVDTLSEQLVKFGPTLKTMGFGIDDSIAMLAKWSKEGVNIKGVLGALNTATVKWSKAGITDTSGALNEVVTAIKGAGSAAQANKIALTAFGSKGIYMADAIRSGKLEIGDLVKQLGHSRGAILKTGKDTADASEKMKLAMNKLKLAAYPVGAALSESIGSALEVITPGIEALSKALNGMDPHARKVVLTIGGFLALLGPGLFVFGKFITLIGTSVKTIGTLVKVMNVLRIAMLTNPVGIIITALALLAVGLYLAYTRSEKFRKVVTGAFHAIQKASKFAVDFIRKHWKLMLAMLIGPMGVAVLMIVKHWNKIKSVGAAAFRFITLPIRTTVHWLKEVVKWAEKAIALAGRVKGAASSAPGKVGGALKSIIPHRFFSKGGVVTGGTPGKDSVPAILTPGEQVLTMKQRIALGLVDGPGKPATHTKAASKAEHKTDKKRTNQIAALERQVALLRARMASYKTSVAAYPVALSSLLNQFGSDSYRRNAAGALAFGGSAARGRTAQGQATQVIHHHKHEVHNHEHKTELAYSSSYPSKPPLKHELEGMKSTLQMVWGN